MHVDLAEATYELATTRLSISKDLSFFDALRQLKYEQVRRYNDYINYNDRTRMHARRMALSTI